MNHWQWLDSIIEFPFQFFEGGNSSEELKDELKNTTDEIDKMIDICNSMGAYGSKIVGSGGGGSIVAIFDKNISESVVSKLKENGAKDAFIASQSNGPEIKANE